MEIPNEHIYELAIQTTSLLNDSQSDLQNIQWNEGEANLDTQFSTLACLCCKKAWQYLQNKYPEYNSIQIECNLPDIQLTFKKQQQSFQSKIELKSSKSTKMPGSTIRNLDINQPLIYCLRPNDSKGIYKVRCSQYHQVMTQNKYDLFQDRTPRPILNFEAMTETPYVQKEKDCWVNHYATSAIHRLDKACKHSWQDDIIQKIKELILNDFIQTTSIESFKQLKESIK